jgi:hypothetical protein
MEASDKSSSKRSQAEQDKSSAAAYWLHAVEFGTHYYIVGRYSMFSGFGVVSGNLMHHAVELLLKACLARQDPDPNANRKPDTWAQIQKYRHTKSYRHNLEKLWSEFKTRNPDVASAEHDEVIRGLNKFEDIRYPDNLIQGGAVLSVSLYEVRPEHRTAPIPALHQPLVKPESRMFYLELPRIDRLVQMLFRASHCNPEVLNFQIHPHAAEYHWLQNAAPLLPPTSRRSGDPAPTT